MAAQVWQAPGSYSLLIPKSPLMTSPRPGALIAGTWAAMQYMGQECVPKFLSLH